MTSAPLGAIRRFVGTGFLYKVLGTAGWQVTDKVSRMVVGLVVGVWVARYLGPSDFGLLNFAIAFVALFSFLADLGLQAIVIRELVRRPEDRLQIVASALVLRLVGAVVAVAAAMLAILVFRPQEPQAHSVVLIIALGLIAQAWDVIDYDYQSRMYPVPIVVARVSSLFVFSALKIGLILGGAGLVAFAWATAGELALSAVLFWILFRRQAGGVRLSAVRRAEVLQLLDHSWPLAIASLSVLIYMRIDQVMLGQMLDDHAVGIFSAAVRISESWYFVPMALLAAVSPALTAAYESSEEEYRSKTLVSIRLIVWVGVGLALAITVFSKPLIAVLFGPEYAQARDVLAVHAWAGVFASLGVASGPWFVNAGLTRLRMIYTITGAVANIGMNLYAIPRFGVVGAAFATLVSQGFSGLLLNAFSSRTRPVFRLQIRSLLCR